MEEHRSTLARVRLYQACRSTSHGFRSHHGSHYVHAGGFESPRGCVRWLKLIPPCPQVSRLEARREETIRITGEAVYRTWRRDMTSSTLEFKRDNVSPDQTLFSKPNRDRSGLRLSREDLYQR